MYCNIEKKLRSCIILFYGGFVLLWESYRIMVAIHNLTRHSVVNLEKTFFLNWYLFQNSQLQSCF